MTIPSMTDKTLKYASGGVMSLEAYSPGMPIDELQSELVKKGEPVFEAVAATGDGVFDTLKAVAKQVLTELRKS